MASNNNVVINIRANDEASVVIRNLNSQLDNGLTKSLGRATLGANLMTGAITAGLQAVGNLASKSISLFKEAATTQTSIISTAGNVMKLTGLNFKQATSFVEDFQSEMAKVAATLPGMASEFADFGRGILDDVLPAFTGLDGKLDSIERKAALSSVKDLSTYGTLLAKSAGMDATAASSQAAFFLSGTRSMNQLKKLDLYEKNTTFRNELERILNGRDPKDLSKEERFKAFLQAARLDPEVLKGLSESVEGVFGLVNDKIFGLETGIFGFMRDLDSQTEGKQTALSSINQSLLALFGPGGLFENLDISLRKLGISLGDPMLALKNGADSFTRNIKNINEFFKDFNDTNDISFLKSNLSSIFNLEGLGNKLAAFTNRGLDFLGTLDWGSVFGFVGTKLAELFNEIFRFIIKLDFVKIGDVILKALGGLFIGLGKFLSNLDWGALLLTLGKLIGYALLGVATAMLVAPIVASIGTLGLAIAGLITGIVSIVAANWEDLSNSIKSFTGKISQFWDNVETHIENFFVEIIKRIPVIGEVVAKAEAKNPGLLKQSIGNSLNTFGSALRFGARLIPGFGSLIPNSADGRVDGLIAAAIREGKASPPGSGLVVANTSEAILNRQQQSALVNSLGRRGAGLSIGSINIHTQATDAKGIARDVMRAIVSEYNNFSQGYITAPVN